MDLKGKYGLIIPANERSEAKAAASVKPAPKKQQNVFGEDSDSEPDEDTDWVKKTMKKQSYGSIQQKQSVQAIRRAIADDPTVYQYDELYDDMEQKRVDSKESKKEDRKPKYIENLLKTAEKRKQEDEARQERLVQKEREAEGDQFKDKEAFVTGAYRKKMEDLEKAKEEERRRDALDAMVDVTKQKDLSGFYRHLYRQQLEEPEARSKEAAEKAKDSAANVVIKKEVTEIDDMKQEDRPRHIALRETSEERYSEEDRKKLNKGSGQDDKKRSDRDRYHSRDERSNRDREKRHDDRRHDRDRDRRHEGRRSDRDRDRRQDDRHSDRNRGDKRRDHDRDDYRRRDKSRDSSRHRDRSSERKLEKRRDEDRSRSDRDRHNRRRDSDTPERTSPEKKPKIEKEIPKESVVKKTEVKQEEIEKEVKPRVSIWVKRTVGDVFDQALARYFARKQANTLQACIAPAT